MRSRHSIVAIQFAEAMLAKKPKTSRLSQIAIKAVWWQHSNPVDDTEMLGIVATFSKVIGIARRHRGHAVDLFDVIKSCLRRFYLLLPMLLLVAWYSHSTYSEVKPVYYAQTVIGLAPPSLRIDDTPPGVPRPRNGLLDVGGAQLIANMTALGLMERSVMGRVEAGGGLPDYTAKMFPVPAASPTLPLVMIEITAAKPADATKTLDLAVQQAAVTVRNLQQQAQVPDDQMVSSFIVSPPSTPGAVMPSRTRATISIFAAGAALAVVLTVLVDVLLSKRKSRVGQRPAQPVAAAGPEPDPEPAYPSNNSVEPNHGIAEDVMETT